MDALPFEEQSFDAIWSEGAIYNIGFANGIQAWRRFLKPDGILAVSELTWLTQASPAELEQHWNREYPEVDTASAKMAILEDNGFSPMGYFPLSERCWLDNYYRPMQDRFAAFLERNDNSGRQRPSWPPKNTKLPSTSNTPHSSVMAIMWREGLPTEPLRRIHGRVNDLGATMGAFLAFSSTNY